MDEVFTWVIQLPRYGSFLFVGTRTEANTRRAAKARWEAEVAHLRKATSEEVAAGEPLSRCWNHPGFKELNPKRSRFRCSCGNCPEVRVCAEGAHG